MVQVRGKLDLCNSIIAGLYKQLETNAAVKVTIDQFEEEQHHLMGTVNKSENSAEYKSILSIAESKKKMSVTKYF